MNARGKRRNNTRRVLAWLLCMALLFESTSMQVLAETSETGMEGGMEISPQEIVSVVETVNSDENSTNDGGEDSILASGTYYGMDWVISGDGVLTISGVYDNSAVGTSWSDYQDVVTSAKVTATGVKSTHWWFYDMENLTSVDLSEFNTSQVTDMSYMFTLCYNLGNLDLSGFNTSQVTDMRGMFWACRNLGNLDLSSFDTSQVTDMCNMFEGCSDLTDLDVSSFDTSQVTNMSGMFSGCSGLTSLDLSGFTINQETTTSSMLSGCSGLETIYAPKNLNSDIQLPCMYIDSTGVQYSLLPKNTAESIELKKDESFIAIGKYYGMDWQIDNDGVLTISGVYDESAYGSFWSSYMKEVTSAKVTATGVKSTNHWFSGMENLTSVNVSSFNTSQVTDMNGMFSGCRNLSNLDLSGFDTSQVTDMSNMFSSCHSLGNLDLSGFDTSRVTDMSRMFSNCDSFLDSAGLTSLDLSSFTISQDTVTTEMLSGCSGLVTIQTPKNGNNDIDLPYMYVDAAGVQYSTLPKNTTESIELKKDETVAAVGRYYGMKWQIQDDGALTISGVYDASNEGNKWRDFYCSYGIRSAKVTATGVESTREWFKDLSSLQSIDLSEFDTSQVTDMSGMFQGCSGLTDLDVSNFDTGLVTNMSYMFHGCRSLTSLDVSGFDTDQVTDMSYMFQGCSGLTDLDVSNFDTSQVTNMCFMFHYCQSLESLDVSNFNTSQVTNMNCMFESCNGLEELNLSNFNTSQVTDMRSMFQSCSGLTSLDLSSFNTDQVTDMGYLFYYCQGLESLNLSSFDMSQVTDAENMLYGCNKLETINTPKSLTLDVELPHIFVDTQGTQYSFLPLNTEESLALSKDETILDNGRYYGMDWQINVSGELLISGEYDATNRGEQWSDYYYTGKFGDTRITSAKVTATGVQSTEGWFSNLGYLQSVDFSEFDTSQVTNMGWMFNRCLKLTSLDLSNFDTSQVCNMYSMFAGCKSLTALDLSNFDMSKVEDTTDMLNGCVKLEQIKAPANLIVDVQLGTVFKDAAGTEYTMLPLNTAESVLLYRDKSVLAAGIYRGMDWRISNEGALTVSGEYDSSYQGRSWHSYDENIISAKVTATGVKSTGSWFEGMYYLQSVDFSEFDTSQVENMIAMFGDCRSLVSLDLSKFNTASVSNMNSMFYNCRSLKYLDISGFDTSQVTDMYQMFYNCESLTGLDLSSFNTSQVTEMYQMFYNCESLTSLDVSSFDTSQIDRMYQIFYNCKNLTNLDVSSFDTSQVYNMNGMFAGCEKLTALEVRGFNTGNVNSMYKMFYNCESLTSLDVSSFDTGLVDNMSFMFADCNSLRSLDLSNFDMWEVEDATDMFAGCARMETIHTPQNLCIDVFLPCIFADSTGTEYSNLPLNRTESIVLSKAQDIVAAGVCCGMDWVVDKNGLLTISGEYYYSGGSISSGDAGSMWTYYDEDITSAKVTATGVEHTSEWFKGLENLTSVDFSEFDTSQVWIMSEMFRGCSSLERLDLSDLNTSQVTGMSYMFEGCSNLKEVDVSSFDTSRVEYMNSMFKNCSSLRNLDLSNFNTTRIDSMSSMFANCSSLTKLDVSSFDTKDVNSVAGMFENCSSLKYLDLSGWDLYGCDLGGEDEVIDLLTGCTSLELLKTPTCLDNEVPLPNVFVDSEGTEYTKLLMGIEESITLTLKKDTGGEDDDTDTTDGDDKPGTGDGNDKPAEPGTGDGEDKPGTGDGEDDRPGTDDGEDVLYGETIGEFQIFFVRDQVYTGKTIKPDITVIYGDKLLVAGKDYTVSYKNNINAATTDSNKAPTIIVKGKGNYASSATVEFNILAKKLTETNTTVSEMFANDTGKIQTVKPAVMVDGRKLTAKDYEIEYPDKDKVEGAYKNPGTYNILIKGKGNYQGSIAATMIILGENQIAASKLKVAKIKSCEYKEGMPATPTPKVTYKGKTLELGKDYTISYLNHDRAGKATLIITGLKNTEGIYVAGSVKKTFTIKGTALKKAKVAYNQTATFTGGEICPQVELTIGTTKLRPDVDYEVTYTKNVNVGKGTIILTGCGGYTGTVKKTFSIKADDKVADKVVISFAGGEAKASYNQKGAKPKVIVTLGDAELVEGKDYTVTYKDNKKLTTSTTAKLPTVVVKGKGNYKFTREATFSITEKSMADADISVVSADKFITDKKFISEPVIKDTNGKKLKLGKDYRIVNYTANGEPFAGTGEVVKGTEVTVTVEGLNNYTDTTTTTYRIAEKNISKTKVNKPQLAYNGGEVTFTEEMLAQDKLVITDKDTDKKLVYGTDFIITGYKNNTKKGTATVTIQGIGTYGGTKNVKFKIVSKAINK